MADDSVLYLLADTSRYQEGKVNVLTAQSHILLSRERIKRIKELRASEKNPKNKIIAHMTKIKADIKKLKECLPIQKEKLRTKAIPKPQKTSHPHPARSEIRQELDVITQKLRELGAA